MGFLQFGAPEKSREKLAFRPVSETGDPNQNGTFKYYHGLGAGDMNGDGHRDVLICHGWWESPGDLNAKATWKFHPIRIETESGAQPLPAASNLYAMTLIPMATQTSSCLQLTVLESGGQRIRDPKSGSCMRSTSPSLRLMPSSRSISMATDSWIMLPVSDFLLTMAGTLALMIRS